MIKAIIIDDEERGSSTLQKILAITQQDVQVIGIANVPQEVIELIQKLQPDLVFLDIQMPRINGFELLETLGNINFNVIFTTAHNEFAHKAFRYSAVDYLLKPIDIDELAEALNRVREKMSGNRDFRQLESFFNTLKSQNLDKIALPTTDGLVFVKISDIIRLQSDSNYTKFVTTSKGNILVSKTMGEFEDMLLSQDFFRVHNSHLINLLHIERYIKGEGGTIIMSDKSEIDVSRRKKDEFLKKLEELMFRK